ncbi:MAG: hypothetical protein EPN93_13035 [Spirochaetes bacterium]|nr:MAG: hypothetical protein EPN93_13035 [Spirochaetota bacterium]
MKIDTPVIFLKTDKPLRESLAHLRPGATVDAQILERYGPTRALIAFKGRSLIAEFTGGVPREGSLVLVLERREGERMYFRFPHGGKSQGGMNAIAANLLLDPSGPGKAEILPMLGLLKQAGTGIFAFNAAILGLGGRREGQGSGLPGLLSRMRKLGIKREFINFFSSLFAVHDGSLIIYAETFLAQLYRKSGRNVPGHASQPTDRGEEGPFEAEIKNFTLEIEEVFQAHSGMGTDLLGDLVSALSGRFVRVGEDCFYRELPLLDDNTPPVRVLVKGSSLALSMDLTGAGHIEVIMRETGHDIIARVFCESDAVRQIFEKHRDALSDSLGSVAGKRPLVSFLLVADARRDLEAYRSNLEQMASLDVKA